MTNKVKAIDMEMGTPIFVFEEDDHCPQCGSVINAARGCGDDADKSPDPGDVSICVVCGSYLIFDDNIKVRLMTVDEVCELDNELLYALTTARNEIIRFNESMEHADEYI